MADAMVTARMSQEKKEAGNRVLEQLGTNASQVVNRLYDYVLENKKLPFPEEQGRRKYTQEEIAEAIAWVDSIPRKDRFSTMRSGGSAWYRAVLRRARISHEADAGFEHCDRLPQNERSFLCCRTKTHLAGISFRA